MPFDAISYSLAKKALAKGGITWTEVKAKLESEGSKNVQYDANLDGKVDDVFVQTRVVAATDSKDKRGHYVCDGTADETEINQAIQDLA